MFRRARPTCVAEAPALGETSGLARVTSLPPAYFFNSWMWARTPTIGSANPAPDAAPS